MCRCQHHPVFLLVVFFVLICGCGGTGEVQRAAVSGRVTLDGKPIQNGAILFIPIKETQGIAAGGPIHDGQYGLPMQEGPGIGWQRIEIRGITPGTKKKPEAIGMQNIVPERYNTTSILQKEIKAGANIFDFDLEFEMREN